MKKFLVVAVASLVLLGGQTGLEALPVENLNAPTSHHDERDDWRHSPRHDDGDDYRHEPPAHQGDDDYRHEPPAHHDGENPSPHRGGYQDYGY